MRTAGASVLSHVLVSNKLSILLSKIRSIIKNIASWTEWIGVSTHLGRRSEAAGGTPLAGKEAMQGGTSCRQEATPEL